MPHARVLVGGPEIVLTADAVQPLGLALHELATNAVKYGALSGSAGEVRIDWSLESGPSGQLLRLDWTEQGGPEVAEPKRKGFGQVVIKDMIEHDLGAEATIDYAPTGVRWSMRAPLSRLVAEPQTVIGLGGPRATDNRA